MFYVLIGGSTLNTNILKIPFDLPEAKIGGVCYSKLLSGYGLGGTRAKKVLE